MSEPQVCPRIAAKFVYRRRTTKILSCLLSEKDSLEIRFVLFICLITLLGGGGVARVVDLSNLTFAFGTFHVA